MSEHKPGCPSPGWVSLCLDKGKAGTVNLPGKAPGGGPGFWYENSKFPVPVLSYGWAPLGMERVAWVMKLLSAVAGRYLIDALGPFLIWYLFYVSPQSTSYFLIFYD